MEDGRPVRIRAIVGLGNTGEKYYRTRHNLGFEVVNLLKGESEFVPGRGDYGICETSISSVKIALLKPTTYMNRSGKAVRSFLEFESLLPREVLVVADDFNLPLGRIRLRQSGSDGGHNGLASVIYHLGTEEFPRIRLGIGPVPEGIVADDFVLEYFEGSEIEIAEAMLKRAVQAVKSWLLEGYEKAAAIYNQAVEEN
ncbi:MAG: aminoacyl-tRNA hydrolase [Candidatus Zixiibacteriota bacterium]|nr:MAG: aminoacyl-tRNA hydrolase [candidate division Zixibacteria bacterium]